MNEIRDLLIGVDFGKKNTQICYYDRKAGEPRSLSWKTSEGSYEIPTALMHRKEQGDYVTVTAAEAGEATSSLVDDIYGISGKNESVTTEGDTKESWEITACFFKGILRYLGLIDVVRSTKVIAVTAEELTPCRVTNIKRAFEELGFSSGTLLLLDHHESFYYYVMTQGRELPGRSAAWYRFDGDYVEFRKLSINNGAKPITVKLLEPVNTVLPEKAEERDEAFSIFIQKTLGQEMFSSIQITGNGFDQAWAKRSIRILCFGKRKVFFGNNLYARGACAAAKERAEDHRLKNFRFISSSLIGTDVGMEMRVMGSKAYYPMIRSGSSWYECGCTCEFLLDGNDELIFEVTRPPETEKKKVSMKLPGLPSRPPKTTRLQLDMSYISEEKCRITVKDLGFGEMFPSSGQTWTETVEW